VSNLEVKLIAFFNLVQLSLIFACYKLVNKPWALPQPIINRHFLSQI